MIKCPKCGAELSDDTKFCSYCGNRISTITPHSIADNKDTSDTFQENESKTHTRTIGLNNSVAPIDKIKGYTSEKWRKSSTYDKVLIVAIVLFALLCMLAFIFGKTVAGIVAILQIVLTAVALLIKKQIIKTSKGWISFIALALAVVLLVPYISLLRGDHDDRGRFAWSDESITEAAYDVSIEIECVENWIFSKYDVDVYIDDSFEGTIEHGTTETYTVALTKGIYEIRFVSAEDDEVAGMAEIDIHQDESLRYKISCMSTQIEVETIAGTIPEHDEDEAPIPQSASDYEYDNYADVEKELEDAGFSNISFEILYDIELGLTEEGEIESVSVDGNTEFEKGDIFRKDTPIIITYHMREEDDPDKFNESDIVETEAPETNEMETEPAESVSEYEIAFVRKLSGYNLYMMFDTDTETAAQFGTDDTYLYKGPYTGEFSTGVTIAWDHGEFTEKFIYQGGYTGTLYGGNGVEWEYSKCDLKTAQDILDTRE